MRRYAYPDPSLEKFARPCSLQDESFQCAKVHIGDIKDIREKFYASKHKIEQDQQLVMYWLYWLYCIVPSIDIENSG